ncbi:MAG: S-methyl-5-thioribose-1-phosphate isomerase [Oscillospiraceae bacterium]|jgi:methylthioribose-1-phosphate isomerase|nr:S-methyl-5-thioribose-1-phosphate isomerase [Oscillospiraceae bacterium]
MYTLKFERGPDRLTLLDQTLLPSRERYIELTSAEQVREAIASLRVRGAPAIGVAAAYGLCLAALRGEDVDAAARTLLSARPTAVSLALALERCRAAENAEAMVTAARGLEEEEEAACRAIGRAGLPLLAPGMGVLTVCNAGALATCGIGTALAPLYTANEMGYKLKVYCCETRPLLQGARLTAFELLRSGADVTLICDAAAAGVMAAGRAGAVFAGADRVAANGDTANKVGTLPLAICARHYNVPLYICAPRSAFDPGCADGRGIAVEERDGGEITDLWFARPAAPRGVKTFNPAFDITPARLIAAFITEAGVIWPNGGGGYGFGR